MKITHVEPIMLAAPISEPWRKPWNVGSTLYTKSHALLVRVDTDEGISGFGECMIRYVPEPVASAAIVHKLLAPAVIGQNAFDVELLWDRMHEMMRRTGHSKGFLLEAMSGVDIAIWDIIGKALNQPVYRLLGSYGRSKLPVYGSPLRGQSIEALTEVAEELINQGYKSLKMYIGANAQSGGLPDGSAGIRTDVDIDIRNVRHLRKVIGDRAILMVDASGSYDVITALRIGRALESEGIFWFEEPISPDNLDGYIHLAQELDIPIAAGQSEFGRWGFKELFARKAIDIAQPDLGRVGGLTEARKVGNLASAFNIPITTHTASLSAVLVAATRHCAAAMPNFLTCEHLYVPTVLQNELLEEPLSPAKNGEVEVPNQPGLGIKIDQKALRRFRVDI